jgi:predicted GNAT family acetyltransferase
MTSNEVEIRFRPEARRFEIAAEGEVAGYARFYDRGGRRTFVHTEIDAAHEGRGLGGQLIRAALDQTRAAGLGVVPECPFVRAFIEDHPEYADLVDAA